MSEPLYSPFSRTEEKKVNPVGRYMAVGVLCRSGESAADGWLGTQHCRSRYCNRGAIQKGGKMNFQDHRRKPKENTKAFVVVRIYTA